MVRALLARARDLWERALHEHATPREIGAAVALGVLVGCTPLVGLHLGVALALSTILRVNRVWTALGSRVSFFVTLPWIVVAEVDVAHRLRTGRWASLLPRDAVDHAPEYLVDWWLGFVPVGGALALVLGLLAYGLAERRARLTPRRPSRPPPPISGSPP